MNLSKETVLDAIKKIKPVKYKNHGFIIAWTDIYEHCRNMGFDNSDILNSRLQQLSSEGYCEIVTEDITYGITGVRLNS